jgi:uncharacterized membrane protein (DUF373 family)
VGLKDEWTAARGRWAKLTLYQRFEHAVILLLTGIIAVVVVATVWNLALNVLFSVVLSGALDPSNYAEFQTVFGMIFTVIIALEFKRSLLVLAERRDNVVQVRSVILIALLAVVRKLLILDVTATDALQLIALAAAILALGGVYWLVRPRDPRERAVQRTPDRQPLDSYIDNA